MENKRSIIVTGATGNQGGHVARALLKRGHNVIALTRAPHSHSAKTLQVAGASLITGDMTALASLENIPHSVDGMFLMGTPFEQGTETEIQQGITMLEFAAQRKLPIIYSSVAAASQNTGIPHFESKWYIEQQIQKTLSHYTIIAPTYFMENLITFGKQALEANHYAMPMHPDQPLAQICLDDIANCAVLALENPVRFKNKRIAIAGDALTGSDVATILSEVLQKNIRYVQTPIEPIRQFNAGLAAMWEWFDRIGYDVDILNLRREYPEIHWQSFANWAKCLSK